MLDYEVEKTLYSSPFGGSNICIFFKSGVEFFESVMENSIDSMYYNYFSHIDDNSGEWTHAYLDMVDYIRNKYKNKIIKHYYDNCSSGSIPLKESIRRILREGVQDLNENDELTNRILDKISNYGIESLSKSEKKYLDNKSQDIEDDEVSDIASIHTGYQFRDIIDDYDGIFIYNETEEWDEDPVEYKHTGEFFIDGKEYYATMYTDEDLNVHSFDLHDGNDYVEFDEEFEESLFEFFQQVGDKIKQNLI